MRQAFQSFTAAHHLPLESVRYSDSVTIRLLFEATTRAFGTCSGPSPTNRRIQAISGVNGTRYRHPLFWSLLLRRNATNCLRCTPFLLNAAALRVSAFFWPYANHTVAVWVLRPAGGPAIRVVVPTTQIFLEETDFFDTPKFNPWSQKTIYEYTRRDLPDSLQLPPKLFGFFLQQTDKYAGASDGTLQQLRYLRDAVLQKAWTPEQAALAALQKGSALSKPSTEDAAAFDHFIQDMR